MISYLPRPQLATRDTERVVLAEIRKLPADGSFEQLPDDHGAFDTPMTVAPVAAWRSRHFIVQLYPEIDGAQRLSVQRTGANGYIRKNKRDERPISWDDLMEVKRGVGLGDRWAVEIYPPDREAVTACLMRHLWLLPEAPACAWKGNLHA